MPTSEARVLANRRNSLRSTGPKTTEGKERSRRNGLKHGLSGDGVVLADQDSNEVELRNDELQAEFAPKTAFGRIMVRQMATLSIRMERAAEQETANLAARVRNAAEAFDQARLDEAERLLDLLGEEPRIHLRKLRNSPEGVDRLVEAWQELRADLTRDPRPVWTAWHRERAENLTGRRIEAASGSEFARLSKAFWGDVAIRLIDEETEIEVEAGLSKSAAIARLIERIDAEIAKLEAHFETLDCETIDLDRAEAPSRALFDPSREATLARRYELAANRGFFKALAELRRAEAEAAERPEPAATPDDSQVSDSLASSWIGRGAPVRQPQPEPPPTRQPLGASPIGPLNGAERGEFSSSRPDSQRVC